MPTLDIVFEADPNPNILGMKQGPTVGGRSGLENHFALGDSTKLGTAAVVPGPYYTAMLGGF